MGFGRIFLFIFVFALLEAIVLGQVAQAIGWSVTILLTVLTAMMGSLMFRWQGLETWIRLNHRMQRGEMPGVEMVEGVMLLLGGALLITPGFITDGVGFLLLLPQSRRLMAGHIVRKGVMRAFTRAPGQGNVWVYQRSTGRTGTGPGATFNQDSDTREAPAVYEDRQGHFIIEGEVEKKDDTP
ncbi:MAG: FxsA family protein [Pseudomonadota bacterium]|nr:FxsA family protein [Pseudomonadota bacterium]